LFLILSVRKMKRKKVIIAAAAPVGPTQEDFTDSN
jgi:hypothetical protein